MLSQSRKSLWEEIKLVLDRMAMMNLTHEGNVVALKLSTAVLCWYVKFSLAKLTRFARILRG